MSNLTRYNVVMRSDSAFWEIEDSPQGQFVKFDDIMEFLKPTTNTGSPKLATCSTCSYEVTRNALAISGDKFCKECGRQLRAGA
jgi:hypothetical protein